MEKPAAIAVRKSTERSSQGETGPAACGFFRRRRVLLGSGGLLQ